MRDILSPLDGISSPLRRRAGFNPLVLFSSGVQGVWYDPSDITTIFQDVSGNSPITAAGQYVARINDKSGRGNNATQATAGGRPQYQIDGGGRPYLLFDGADDLVASSNITQLVAPWEFWAAINITVAGGINTGLFFVSISGGALGSPSTEGLFQRSDGANRSLVCGSRIGNGTNYSATLANAFVLNTPFVARASAESGPDQLRVTVGVNTATASAVYTGTPGSTSTFRIGASSASSAFRFYGGLIIDRGLTSIEASSLSAFFKNRVGA